MLIEADVPGDNNDTAIPEDAVPQGNPFTPEGQGAVLDNAYESDGKEFFTIATKNAELVFYLVIDRERPEQNVYLLRAVSEADLYEFVSALPEESVDRTNEPHEEAVPRFSFPTSPVTAPTEPDTIKPEETILAEQPQTPTRNLKQILAMVFITVMMLLAGVVSFLKLRQDKNRKNAAFIEYDPNLDDEEERSPDDDYEELL